MYRLGTIALLKILTLSPLYSCWSIRNQWNYNTLSDSLHAYDLQPGTQQHHITPPPYEYGLWSTSEKTLGLISSPLQLKRRFVLLLSATTPIFSDNGGFFLFVCLIFFLLLLFTYLGNHKWLLSLQMLSVYLWMTVLKHARKRKYSSSENVQ